MRDLTGGARNAIAAERYRVAREGGSPTSRPPISRWRLRREPPRVERRFAEGRPRLAYDLCSFVVLLDGPRSRPRQQRGSQNDRPSRRTAAQISEASGSFRQGVKPRELELEEIAF